MQTEIRSIGLLHPGAMGAEVGRALRASDPGRRVIWAADGRSDETRARARVAGLDEVATLDDLVADADVVLSVCPPGAAVDVARSVAERGFTGPYVDANASSPATARSIADIVGPDRMVDGGIIGPPPSSPGTTRIYLSGGGAMEAATWFEGSDLEARVVDGPAGAASAVKMCFGGWTKGTSALLMALRALASAEGVEAALLQEWSTSMPELISRSDQTAAGVGPKAWRFEAEMHEIADTFASADLPDGFHRSAAEVYRRMAGFKGRPHGGDDAVELAEVIESLLPANLVPSRPPGG